MKIKVVALVSVLMLPALAGAATPTPAPDGPSMAIKADGDFQTALTAAIVKKKVPAIIVEDPSKATYTLKSATVYSKDESGAGKIARCMFADCIGMNGYSSVSVQLLRNSDDGGCLGLPGAQGELRSSRHSVALGGNRKAPEERLSGQAAIDRRGCRKLLAVREALRLDGSG